MVLKMMFGIHLYQIAIIIIAFISIFYVYLRVRQDKTSPPALFLWIVLWFIIFLFAFVPDITGVLASLFGITRGLDFVLICGIIFCLLLCIKLYSKIDDLEQNITKLVRELAIANENKDYKKREEEK